MLLFNWCALSLTVCLFTFTIVFHHFSVFQEVINKHNIIAKALFKLQENNQIKKWYMKNYYVVKAMLKSAKNENVH